MSLNFKLKQLAILVGDVVFFYGALVLTLIIRYGQPTWLGAFPAHFKPFSLILIVWLLVFYLIDLYQVRILKNNLTLIANIFLAVIIAATISVILFYLFTPVFKLTPKTNLFIFGIVFGTFGYLWRLAIAKFLLFSGWRYRLLIIGDSPRIEETISFLKANPLLGYDVILWLKNVSKNEERNLLKSISENKINTIVIPPQHKNEFTIVKSIYQLLPLELTITDFISFYETVFGKIPLEELEENWFIEKIITRKPLFDFFKRLFDLLLAFIFGIIFIPLAFLIAILIKITSKGPIIFKQQRMGKNNKVFWLYKFRTMENNSSGPLWTIENDKRLTPFGKFLRFSHLDEIPQLFNILKGDIAFVGPRAERIELAKEYERLPYYEIRHIIKPGFTGWAQINYRPSASLEESFEKLKYDIYYIKNRSLFLDLLIIFKTIRLFFTKVK
jgi:exopolysaccharide biosynthesis polyprenyl glycosylphosphotransferase